MVRYSENEKKDMYDVYIRCYRNSDHAAQMYGTLFPERQQPSKKTFFNISKNMMESGRLSKKRNKYQVTENVSDINVLAQIHINPENSTRNISRECSVSATTVKRILKKHKYHAFKFRRAQKLHPNDAHRRLAFCQWFRRELIDDDILYKKILWSDETKFTNTGIFNPRNKHYYAQINPHLIHEVRPQRRFSINLWCGIIGEKVIGPFFLEENLNAERYLALLEEVFDNIPLSVLRTMKYFMQDGCGPHNAVRVQQYLNREFPVGWIGTSGPIRWPPRSPCLNPLDYFLWGFLKNEVYSNNLPNSVDEFRERILAAFQKVTPLMVSRATSQITRRINLCIQNEGQHFEQFL